MMALISISGTDSARSDSSRASPDGQKGPVDNDHVGDYEDDAVCLSSRALVFRFVYVHICANESVHVFSWTRLFLPSHTYAVTERVCVCARARGCSLMLMAACSAPHISH
jgi:hypothetical protein